MPSVPAPADPGRDGDPAWPDRDPMTAAEREAWLDRLCAQDDDPSDAPQEYWDPESCAPPPGQDELTADELAGVAAAASDEGLALDAASTGRRGPGQAGSARTFPGESASRAAGFGTGMAWDVMPGCAQLAVAADAAAGRRRRPGDSFGGVADHELIGLVCAFDRAEAYMAARKLVAIAEVFRRNPEDGFEAAPGRMPAVVHEFTRDQLAFALGESRAAADWLLTVAWHLATRLAATLDALAGGIITRGKAELIVRLTQYLDGGEAKAAEAKVLGRAGRLTPGSLRSALARAVMEVAPDKARERREKAARTARVERWAEDSGNAALMGRELPPDEVLACDQRITAWAGELRKAGLEGGMDELRARAFLDLVLGKDSRPRAPGTAGTTGRDAAAGAGPAPGTGPAGGPAGGAAGGFAGRVTLTVPLGTAAGQADRPGELAGLGPVDPWLARDLVPRRRAEPEDDLVRDRDRPGRPRRGSWLRPARTQKPRETRRARAAGVLLHPGQPGRAARRIRHLAAARSGWRAGPDRRDRHPGHPPLRAPVPGPGPRPRGQAPAPVPGPARHLHQPGLPAARPDLRLRAQHPVRGGRTDLLVQRRPEMPSRPPAQAAAGLEGRPAPRRDVPLDHPGRAQLRHRTHPLPHLAVHEPGGP